MFASEKPSAIDDLMAEKPIAEMTADEYAALARQAHITIRDVERLRHQIHDGIERCRVAASRTGLLLRAATPERGRRSA
jgi:hypothetical protein